MIIGINSNSNKMSEYISRMMVFYTMDPELRTQVMDGIGNVESMKESRNLFLNNNLYSNEELSFLSYDSPNLFGFERKSFRQGAVEVTGNILFGTVHMPNWEESTLPSDWTPENDSFELFGSDYADIIYNALEGNVDSKIWIHSLFKDYFSIDIDFFEDHMSLSSNIKLNSREFPDWIVTDVVDEEKYHAIIHRGDPEENNDFRGMIKIYHSEETGRMLDIESSDLLWKFEITPAKMKNVDELWDSVLTFMESYPELESKLTI